MYQSDYIELVREKEGITTDTATAKLLGVSRQAIAQYKNNEIQFSPEIALKIAKILKIEPWRIAADMFAARSTNKKTKKEWMKYGGIMLLVLSAALPYTLNNTIDSTQLNTVNSSATRDIHYAH